MHCVRIQIEKLLPFHLLCVISSHNLATDFPPNLSQTSLGVGVLQLLNLSLITSVLNFSLTV